MSTNSWKLQDAKARFSEVVRLAKAGEPQRVTLHGKEAVAVVDTTRFNVTPKASKSRTGRDFIEASKKYRGTAEGIDFSRNTGMVFRDRTSNLFENDTSDEGQS